MPKFKISCGIYNFLARLLKCTFLGFKIFRVTIDQYIYIYYYSFTFIKKKKERYIIVFNFKLSIKPVVGNLIIGGYLKHDLY